MLSRRRRMTTSPGPFVTCNRLQGRQRSASPLPASPNRQRVTTSRAPVVTRNLQQGRQRSASPRPAGRLRPQPSKTPQPAHAILSRAAATTTPYSSRPMARRAGAVGAVGAPRQRSARERARLVRIVGRALRQGAGSLWGAPRSGDATEGAGPLAHGHEVTPAPTHRRAPKRASTREARPGAHRARPPRRSALLVGCLPTPHAHGRMALPHFRPHPRKEQHG